MVSFLAFTYYCHEFKIADIPKLLIWLQLRSFYSEQSVNGGCWFCRIFQMLLMKWHENKSCLIRFDCRHIENQGRKIINFFGISRIQIRTKIRLDHKDLSWTTFWWLDADRTANFGFLRYQDFSICPQSKISRISI